MACQEPLPCYLPAMVVAAFNGAGPLTSMNFGVKFAIVADCQTWTAGMFARTLGLHWHVCDPPLRKENPQSLCASRVLCILRFSHDMILHPKNTPKRTSADILQIYLSRLGQSLPASAISNLSQSCNQRNIGKKSIHLPIFPRHRQYFPISLQ